MDIQTRKLEFIKEFLKISNEEAIAKFEAILKKQKEEPENLFSQEEMIRRVGQSEEGFRSGNFKTSEELQKRFE